LKIWFCFSFCFENNIFLSKIFPHMFQTMFSDAQQTKISIHRTRVYIIPEILSIQNQKRILKWKKKRIHKLQLVDIALCLYFFSISFWLTWNNVYIWDGNVDFWRRRCLQNFGKLPESEISIVGGTAVMRGSGFFSRFLSLLLFQNVKVELRIFKSQKLFIHYY
jgi:hypothetical protein